VEEFYDSVLEAYKRNCSSIREKRMESLVKNLDLWLGIYVNYLIYLDAQHKILCIFIIIASSIITI
jgi:hypothetical protein